MKRRHESGYILIGVIFLITLMLIALAVAAPRIGTQIKRDREEELVHRGRQYVRAIQLYYRRFGRYPASIDQLENTNNLRFLRKKYVDPITGKDEWKVIAFGQQKIKQPPAYLKGTPGQPGTGGAGMSPASGLGGSTTPGGLS